MNVSLLVVSGLSTCCVGVEVGCAHHQRKGVGAVCTNSEAEDVIRRGTEDRNGNARHTGHTRGLVFAGLCACACACACAGARDESGRARAKARESVGKDGRNP